MRRPPQPTGPWLQEGSVVPPLIATTTRSASLADSHGLPRRAGYTAGLCPTTWSGLPPRPSLLCNNAPSLRAITPTPRGGTETPQIRPRSQRLSATKQCVSSSSHPTPAPVGDLLTTLQCSLHATARKVTCPPGLVRPGVLLRPPRTCTPELAPGWSPAPRVGYDYTALLGKDDDRTCTGWSAAVTGCALCRKCYSGSREGAVVPVSEKLRRLGSRTIRPR
jgi:hypothetical protein